MTNRKPTAMSRMKQDYLRLKKDPVPYITAEPLPSNLLEWHYVVKGPEDSPYQGGYYHGTLLFPREFPFKPPSIYMLTPNGRFKTNTRLCLSISDFHPDTWNPTWSVGTILTGLLSFMLESTPTLGSTESSLYEKQQYAKKSLAFNLKNSNFRELFPQICDEINCRLKKQQQLLQASTAGSKLTLCPNSAGEISGVNISGNNHKSNNINNNSDSSRGIGSGIAGQGAISDIDFNENSKNDDSNLIHTNNKNSNSDNYCNWHSIYFNLIAIISFAIFALIVNYVIKNLN
ncbi:ubiquitin-conjugating enzyme E2 J2 [Eupeodes corollae]|uniref:ubiquitin-conjugating enzyme E2 J2 n=1 Tax=Eupeodes corollae TaxID=290404 RepID=UPI002493AF13|nr:ubiquitin-conjugating enzyme E2 J2 [Eupeodes corollae]XP_055922461.1 ubiquitin-conjugating enzyme E2 J2 [Eupeodes corollae]